MKLSRWLLPAQIFFFALVFSIGCGSDETDDPIETDDPRISVPEQVSLEGEIGQTAQESLTITNTGGATLEVELSLDEDSWLSIDPQSFSVEPGESADVTASASCEEEGTQTTTVEIASNDPDRGELTVSVGLRCSDEIEEPPIEADPGTLVVAIHGLPDDIDADVLVEGPDDFSATLTATTTLEDLEAGDYTVEAAVVSSDDLRYRFRPDPETAAVTVDEEDGASVVITYELVPAILTVGFQGLPEGAEGMATVSGPDVFDVEGFTDLEVTPGEYLVEGLTVEFEGTTYLPSSAVTVELSSDDIMEVDVIYGANLGHLSVTVEGLDDETMPSVEIVADDESITELDESGQASLVPGDYTLVAEDVVDGLNTYAAADVSVTITAGEEATATIVYELVRATWELTIDGLPDGVDAAVEVLGEELDETYQASTTFDDLLPGTYEITPHQVELGSATYTAAATSVDLASGENDATQITYAALPGSLELSAYDLPDDLELVATLVHTDLGIDESYTGAQIIDDLAPGDYEVTFEDIAHGDLIYRADPASLTVEITSEATAEATTTYGLVGGALELTATGLPANHALSATVEGVESDYAETFDEATLVADLPPGTYSVTFHNVSNNGIIYGATESTATQQVDIVSDHTATAEADYQPLPGDLAISAQGVPSTGDIAGTVTDSDGTVAHVFAGSTTLVGITPGTYTVTFEDVDQGTLIYRPTEDTREVTVTVFSSAQAHAQATYELVPGAIELSATGLDGGPELQARVTNNTGFDQTYAGAQLIGDLTPGDYLVQFLEVSQSGATYIATPDEVALSVTSDSTASATGDYALAPGNLTLSANGLPESAALEAQVVANDGSFDETFTGAQTIEDLAPGTYSVSFLQVSDGDLHFRATTTSYVITVPSNGTAGVTATYAVVPGALEITATGLPDSSTPFTVTLTGPDHDETEFAGPATIVDLAPGDYLVSFQAVTAQTSYLPTSSSLNMPVSVTSDTTTEVEGEYIAADGALQVIVDFPSEVSFVLEVHREGTVVDSQAVSGGDDVIFTDLAAGTYELQPGTSIEDQWGNPYISGDLMGFFDDLALSGDSAISTTVAGTAPTVVTTDVDDDPYSLREVVGRVVDGTVVTFADGIEEVVLTSGRISINSSISIVGDDQTPITISGNQSSRIFETAEGTEVTLQSLHLIDGLVLLSGAGGAIRAEGDLVLFDVEFRDNESSSSGGALHALGDATLRDVLFIDNFASSNGGAINIEGYLDAERVDFINNNSLATGGALYTQGDVRLVDALLYSNTASSFGGAMTVTTAGATVVIDRSSFIANSTSSESGALDGFSPTITVRNSTFADNSAATHGAAITAFSSDLTLINTTLVNNVSPEDTAIHSAGTHLVIDIVNSVFVGGETDEPQSVFTGSSAFVSGGYNVIEQVSDSINLTEDSTDLVGTLDEPIDARIDGLQEPLGELPYLTLLSDSPAYQAIPAADCTDLAGEPITEDQRGLPRPVEGACTIGAWQPQNPTSEPPIPWTIETFDDAAAALGVNYRTGSFTGVDGINWDFQDVGSAQSTSGGDFQIDGEGALLRQDTRTSDGRFGRLYAEGLPAGVQEISFDYRVAWTNTNTRQLRVIINGDLDNAELTPTFGTDSSTHGQIYTMTLTDLDLTAEFSLEIENLGHQVTVDNIRWR